MKNMLFSNKGIKLVIILPVLTVFAIGMLHLYPTGVEKSFNLVQESRAQGVAPTDDITKTNTTIENLRSNVSSLHKQVEQLKGQINYLNNSIHQLQESDFATNTDLNEAISNNNMEFSSSIEQLGGTTEGYLGSMWTCIINAADYASQTGGQGFSDFAEILRNNCQ